ncbi:hypothetical protein JCM3774_003153 [Rhodotorula dairenensis]
MRHEHAPLMTVDEMLSAFKIVRLDGDDDVDLRGDRSRSTLRREANGKRKSSAYMPKAAYRSLAHSAHLPPVRFFLLQTSLCQARPGAGSLRATPAPGSARLVEQCSKRTAPEAPSDVQPARKKICSIRPRPRAALPHNAPFRRWPPFSLEKPRVDSPTGVEIQFPVFAGAEAAAVGAFSASALTGVARKVLETNTTTQKSHNYVLDKDLYPAAPDSETLEMLLGLLPPDMVEHFVASGCALQPLSGTQLNVEIAKGQRQSLPHYFYLNELYASSEEEALQFLAFASRSDILQMIAELGQGRKYEAWLAGVERFRAAGGWQGPKKRLMSYSGEADGWGEPLDWHEKADPRAFSHFVGPAAMSRFSLHKAILRVAAMYKDETPSSCLIDTLSFVCSAADMVARVGVMPTKSLEAIISVMRYSMADWGGANVSSCGRVDHAGDMAHVASVFPAETPISALRSEELVPASLSLGLLSRSTPDTLIGDALAALVSSKSPPKRQLTKKTTKSATGNGAAPPLQRLRLRPDNHVLSDLSVRFASAEPVWPVSDSPASAALQPYLGTALYNPLRALERAAKAELPVIITPASLRTGVTVDILNDGNPLYERRVRFVIATATAAEVGVLRFSTAAPVGPAMLTFDEEMQRVELTRGGDAMLLRLGYGRGVYEDDASWDKDEFLDWVTVERASGTTSRERQKKTQEKQQKLIGLWEKVLAPWTSQPRFQWV